MQAQECHPDYIGAGAEHSLRPQRVYLLACGHLPDLADLHELSRRGGFLRGEAGIHARKTGLDGRVRGGATSGNDVEEVARQRGVPAEMPHAFAGFRGVDETGRV